ncbi:GNAT family protein [Thermococcus sp. SY098]|uniref:GNAT family N-acetyltransferase n=1 Tax=Thermococcus sp. SY098 TaxID=3111325 RepID=UPI002D7732B6|nr:GNAT family protein [Thermococcus sp. SY098]WRS52782.1 GNAT family protein [Thermococcus sp. SY098]
MQRPIILTGRRVSLSVLLREDIPKVWLWYNDRDVRRYLSSPDAVFYFEDEVEWYERIRREKERHRVFAVIENRSDSLVGLIGVHKINHKNGHAEIGYFLSKQYWGKGYATEAVELVLEYCFKWLNLRKVYARVYEYNVASQRVLEKNGFKLVGRLKKHVHIPEEGFADVLFYELFKDEWESF